MPVANIKATLISEPSGRITGLGLCIEASNIDTDTDTIRATFVTAFDILRLAVDDQIARLAAATVPASQDAPASTPPIDPLSTPTPIAADQPAEAAKPTPAHL